MSYKTTIEFYQNLNKKILANYEIDFLAENDKYNPFASCYKYAETEFSLDEKAYEALVEVIMHQDLEMKIYDLTPKTNHLIEVLLPIVKSSMKDNDIEFKRSSKYFLQSIFARITVDNGNSLIRLFFQLIGYSRKKKIVQ